MIISGQSSGGLGSLNGSTENAGSEKEENEIDGTKRNISMLRYALTVGCV